MFPFIPTCGDEMSHLTYLTFWALITGIGIGVTGIMWWHRREIARLDTRLDKHDTFVSDTRKAISETGTDIAVTREAVENLEGGIKDIKKSIATLVDRLIGIPRE